MEVVEDTGTVSVFFSTVLRKRSERFWFSETLIRFYLECVLVVVGEDTDHGGNCGGIETLFLVIIFESNSKAS